MKKQLRSQFVEEVLFAPRAPKPPEGGVAHLLPYNLPAEEQEIIEKARAIIAKRETHQQRFWAALCTPWPSFEIEE